MKSEEAPIISVVIACYNQGIYLSDALNSLEKQTFQNWEGIIVNDGSTDGTEEIALEYVKKDERFKYVFQENGGVSKARNIGAAQALGTYILPLDADDKLEETYIRPCRILLIIRKHCWCIVNGAFLGKRLITVKYLIKVMQSY